jgi:cyclopropane-fatty-acyl-phospholipid synthase
MSLSSVLLNKMLLTLEKGIQKGKFTLIFPDNREFTFGQGFPQGLMHVKDWRAAAMITARGDIGFGESYMEGLWDTPDLESLLQVMILNVDNLGTYGWGAPLQRFLANLLERFMRRNSVAGSRKNIMAHYDVGNEFYKLWLDKSMTYSSALYKGDDTLETAQKQKYQRILDRLQGHDTILEVGCGWGGFAQEAAEAHELTGITISEAQHAYAVERLKGQADIRLQDYRAVQGKFNGIVSIEMFEAVGEQYWSTYFEMLKNRLARNGKAVIQTITIRNELFERYKSTSDYIRHHIFPGGLLPSPSRFQEEANKRGLKVNDSFTFGQDYAKTLREWLIRFDAVLPQIQAMGYKDPFLRGWQMYLAMCAASFAVERCDVAQYELVHA